jgi:hypothetical protein
MTHYINPWMRCPRCRKIHLRAFITPTTRCACALKLWPVAWEAAA